MTATRVLRTDKTVKVLCRLGWACGWVIALQAATAQLYFEPTDEALLAAQDALPSGVAGVLIMVVAALGRLRYRGWPQVVIFVVLNGVTLPLLYGGTGSTALPMLWLLLNLVVALALVAVNTARERTPAMRAEPGRE